MINNESIIAFLKANAKSLTFSSIEETAGIPLTIISKVLKGDRSFSEEHCKRLVPVLRNFGYKDETQKNNTQVIAIVNQKGGVAKTTTTINLAKALTLLDYTVLIVDIDPQGSATSCLGNLNIDKQVINALLDNQPMPIIDFGNKLFLSPSNIKMADRASELSNSAGAEQRLAKKIGTIKHLFDFILIDCPPDLGIFNKSALVASDSCIIPFSPEGPTYLGMKSLEKTIDDIREFSNENLKIKGIVFTMVRRVGKNITQVHQQIMEKVRKEYKHFPIFNTMLEIETAVSESQVAMQNILDYAPKSLSAKRYMELARELTGK